MRLRELHHLQERCKRYEDNCNRFNVKTIFDGNNEESETASNDNVYVLEEKAAGKDEV